MNHALLLPCLLLPIAMLLTARGPLPTAEAKEPVVGERHPALRLPTVDGKRTIDLGELAGKKVLLIQFASW